MAQGTQFRELIDMLRAEIGQSLDRSVGTNNLDSLKYALRNSYAWLYDSYDWPHLKIYRDEALKAGEKFYSFDPDLPYDNVEGVWAQDAGDWVPVSYGITPVHYNTYGTERRDPVERWAVRDSGQYEVWPTPESDGTLRMYGLKKFVQLREEDDVCQLDDLTVVLMAAFPILAKAESGAAQVVADRLQVRLNRIRSKGTATKRAPFVLGGSPVVPMSRPRPWIDYIPSKV